MLDPKSDPPTWVVVLPPDVPEHALERLHDEATGRAWSIATSRGAEQTVVALAGPPDEAQLDGALRGLPEVDVLRILEPADYRRRRLQRRFLSGLVSGLALLMVLGFVIPFVGYVQPPASAAVPAEEAHVGSLADLPVGEALRTRYGTTPVLVVREAPESVWALVATCTTMDDCTLTWDAHAHQVVCPCHGCAFDARGNVLHPPASVPLARLEVARHGDELYLRRQR